jgi:hypothetical protein
MLSRYVLPLQRMKIQKGMEVPLSEHLVKLVCTQWKSMVILSWVARGGRYYYQRGMRLTPSKVLIMWTVFALHYHWLELHNSKIYFLISIKVWHIYSLLNFSGYLSKIKENRRNKERKKERKKEKVPSTSTCMFNVHSIFIYFCTLLLIVGHHWVELEVPLDISFSCCCSLKIESLIICITTCYFYRSNIFQSSCLVLSPSYSRTSMD